MTGKPVVAVWDFLPDLGLPEEDSVGFAFAPKAEKRPDSLDVALIHLGHIANFTDFAPLEMEPDVQLRTVRSGSELGNPDLIILPGSKGVADDIVRMKQNGLFDALKHSTAFLTGICGGLQMLGERLLEYPDIMTWVGTQQLFIDRPLVKGGKTDLKNTNHLVVPRYPGVDGMKTGYTRAAMFCLTFTAVRDGRRLMGCVTGFPTAKERDVFARRMLDWGYLRAAEIAAGKTAPPAAAGVSVPAKKKR